MGRANGELKLDSCTGSSRSARDPVIWIILCWSARFVIARERYPSESILLLSFFLFSLSLEKQEGIKSSRISVTIDFSNFKTVRLRSLIFSTLARITINDDSCNENRVKLSAFHFIRVYSSTIKFKRTTEQDSFTISRYRRIFFFLLS